MLSVTHYQSSPTKILHKFASLPVERRSLLSEGVLGLDVLPGPPNPLERLNFVEKVPLRDTF